MGSKGKKEPESWMALCFHQDIEYGSPLQAGFLLPTDIEATL